MKKLKYAEKCHDCRL